MGLDYSDNQRIEFTDVPKNYTVGTNSGIKFVSVSSLFLASEDCWIQFNDDNHWERILKNNFFERDRKIWEVKIKRITTNGHIDMWFEGNRKRC